MTSFLGRSPLTMGLFDRTFREVRKPRLICEATAIKFR
jgi:hypothetical protein